MIQRLFLAAVAASALSLFACSSGPAGGMASQSVASASNGGLYARRNLVSDGKIPAEHTDANLVNAWGITFRGTSPWWVSDNGAGVATLYDGEGVAQFGTPPLVVSVAGAGGAAADPTGNVANTGDGFVVSSGGASGPAFFIFASEDGTLSGWNPNVPAPVAPATRSTTTVVAVDESASSAVFKGITLASTPDGERLYATNFRAAKVEVFGPDFHPVATAGGFADPTIPAGYAPFGIRAIGDTVFVTYALQDDQKHDDVAGTHHGFVNAFTLDGKLMARVVSGGKLDSPWGLAMAPAEGFGRFGGKLLVGNFGDGHIVGYDAGGEDEQGKGQGADSQGEGGGAYLTGKDGRITIDGLWGIGFGNGAAAGPATTLFFAAGPNHEDDGLFGRIDLVQGSGDGNAQ